MQNTKLAWGLCRATQHFDDGMSKCKGVNAEHQAGLGVMPSDAAEICRICVISVPLDHSQRIARSNFLLHPSRRMAWKILRHGVAVNFLSPRKKTQQSLTNKYVPIKFYKISKNNSVFILLLQNKGVSLQRNSKQQNNNH